MLLKQKDGSETRIFKIIDNGLKIVEKSEFGEIERIVAFESISNDFVKLKFNPVHWIILSVVVVLFIISGFFLKLFGIEGEGRFYYYLIIFLTGGLSSILFYGKNETVLSCYGEEGIEFYKDKPTKSEFDSFFKELFEKRNEVLKEKHGIVSEFISYKEQIEKFNLLHSLGVISLDEFNEFKDQLNLLAKKDDDEIKFNLN